MPDSNDDAAVPVITMTAFGSSWPATPCVKCSIHQTLRSQEFGQLTEC
jgi:uncharacterized protein (UPF0261 family)